MPLSPRGSGFVRAFAAAVLSMTCGTLVLSAQKPPPKSDSKPDPAAQAQAMAQQKEIQALVRTADAAMSGQQAPAEFPVQFQNDFLKAQGTRVWVPITLTLDPSKMSTSAVTLYLRVTPRGMTAPPAPTAPPDKSDKDKKKDGKMPLASPAIPATAYPYEDVSFLDVKPAAAGQPLRIQHGISVPAGSYDLYIVLHERPFDAAQGRPATTAAAGAPPAAAAAGKTSLLKQPLDVPNYAAGEFTTSTVILAERVDQLPTPIPPDQQSERPYAFGQTEIVISPDHKFKKSQELIVLVQIYNPVVTPEKKFNLEATYTFFRQDAGAEKKFNSTEPQSFSSDTMGAGFDPSGNSSIQAGQGVALQSFPEGAYRLEIKITDKLNAKTLTQTVNFTVTP